MISWFTICLCLLLYWANAIWGAWYKSIFVFSTENVEKQYIMIINKMIFRQSYIIQFYRRRLHCMHIATEKDKSKYNNWYWGNSVLQINSWLTKYQALWEFSQNHKRWNSIYNTTVYKNSQVSRRLYLRLQGAYKAPIFLPTRHLYLRL